VTDEGKEDVTYLLTMADPLKAFEFLFLVAYSIRVGGRCDWKTRQYDKSSALTDFLKSLSSTGSCCPGWYKTKTFVLPVKKSECILNKSTASIEIVRVYSIKDAKMYETRRCDLIMGEVLEGKANCIPIVVIYNMDAKRDLYNVENQLYSYRGALIVAKFIVIEVESGKYETHDIEVRRESYKTVGHIVLAKLEIISAILSSLYVE